MKKASIRVLSMLLVLCMVIGMVPMMASADYTASATGRLSESTAYQLVNTVTKNKNYLIATVSDGKGVALLAQKNSDSPLSANVSVSGGVLTFENQTQLNNSIWKFTETTSYGRTYYTANNAATSRYINLSSDGFVSKSAETLTVSASNGSFTIKRGSFMDSEHYIGVNNGAFVRSNSATQLYLYQETKLSEKNATFTVTGASTSNDAVVMNGGTSVQLVPNITLADGSAVTSSDIIWSISGNCATINENGVVTATSTGTATVTATLNSVNGRSFKVDKNNTTPSVTIPIRVEATLKKATLKGNSDITVKPNGTPNYSGISLVLEYEGGTKQTISADQLTFSTVDTSSLGEKTVSISYNGKNYGTVKVIVSNDPYAGLDKATSFPVYPAPGSVRLNKTATEMAFDNTGTVQVELNTAGISMKTGVDVVLTIDISNSMAWKNGGTADNMTDNKLLDVMDAIKEFAAIFLKDNVAGSADNNTITIVTFGGYDKENFSKAESCIDATRILVSATDSQDIINQICNNTKFLNGNTATNNYDSYDLQLAYYDEATKTVKTEHDANRGDTNYDFAFWQTEQAVIQGNLGQNGRALHVLFMTDGCASNYNNTYYRKDTNALNPGSNTNCKGETDYRGSSTSGGGKAWTNLILESIAKNGGNIYAKSLYERVDSIHAIGFDMEFGSFSGIYDWDEKDIDWEDRFNNIVSKSVVDANGEGLVPVTPATSPDELKAFYNTLAHELRKAGTEAKVTDVINSVFTLQLDIFGGKDGGNLAATAPNIEIRQYETWTAAEVNAGKYNQNLIGTRKRYDSSDKLMTDPTDADYHTGTYKWTKLEEVTFTYNDGVFTETAKSSLLGDTNIYSKSGNDATISAKYFTYTKIGDVETFKWNIGDITEGEVSLNYYAYLENSMGEDDIGVEEDFYYTNEYAYLEYIDINGDYAKRDFPMPQVYWGGASTMYEFYLVNEAGEPVDRNGNKLLFEDRIVIKGPFAKGMNLNTDDEVVSLQIIASQVLPAGYTLYDETSSYTVNCASGTLNGSLVVSQPGYGQITPHDTYSGIKYKKTNDGQFVVAEEGYTGVLYKELTAQTTIVVSANTPTYVQSHVAFGVCHNLIPEETSIELTPDQVVIDYGKPILVDITNGFDVVEDEDGKTYDTELVGFGIYDADVALNHTYTNTSADPTYPGAYGTFSIEDAADCVVKYTPNTFVNGVENIFCHIKLTELDEDGNHTSNYFYMVDWLTVIPATNVYYEAEMFMPKTSTHQMVLAEGATPTYEFGTQGVVDWMLLSDTQMADTFAKAHYAVSGMDLTKRDSNAATDAIQNDGTIGQTNHTYGYDSTYKEDAYLSDGSSWYVEGEGYANTYTSFAFNGTGFDLYSRTGTNQGQIKVQIYSDAAMENLERTVTVLNKSESELELFQIPVVSVTDTLDYGMHYVKISVSNGFYNEKYPALNRGNQFFLDAIRVYNPALEDAVANAAYSADGEANNNIQEVRALLLSQGEYWQIGDDVDCTGVTFIDRIIVVDEEKNTTTQDVDISTYDAIGPNNEVYLQNGQAIAFKLTTGSVPASLDIGAKTINGGVAYLQVSVAEVADNDQGYASVATVTKEIASSTAQYIDLMSENVANALEDNSTYIIVTNTGDDVLSITDIKVAYQAAAAFRMANPYEVSYTVDTGTFALARAVLTAPVVEEEEIPETEPEVTEPEATEPEATEPEAPKPGADKDEKPKPGADKKDPAADKKDPAADKKDPAADKKDPAADKKDPAADKKDPAADKKDPAADKKDPAADKKDPAADKKDPAADKKNPAADKKPGQDKKNP